MYNNCKNCEFYYYAPLIYDLTKNYCDKNIGDNITMLVIAIWSFNNFFESLGLFPNFYWSEEVRNITWPRYLVKSQINTNINSFGAQKIFDQ